MCNYLHMRKAECVTKKETFQRANYDKSVDFMDSLEEDIPKGMLPAAKPHVGSGAVRIGPLCFLTRGRKRRTKSGCRLFS